MKVQVNEADKQLGKEISILLCKKEGAKKVYFEGDKLKTDLDDKWRKDWNIDEKIAKEKSLRKKKKIEQKFKIKYNRKLNRIRDKAVRKATTFRITNKELGKRNRNPISIDDFMNKLINDIE